MQVFNHILQPVQTTPHFRHDAGSSSSTDVLVLKVSHKPNLLNVPPPTLRWDFQVVMFLTNVCKTLASMYNNVLFFLQPPAPAPKQLVYFDVLLQTPAFTVETMKKHLKK